MGSRGWVRRRSRAGAVVAAALVLTAASCSHDDPVQTASTATSPSTTAATTTTESTTTTTEATTTTVAPTTTAAPVTTAAPTPPPPVSVFGRTTTIDPSAPPIDPGTNVYGQIGPANLNPTIADVRPMVYVPHEVSGTTTLIDPKTLQIVGTFPTGPESQHVVPAYDLQTLYAVSGQGNRITPIDPRTGQPGPAIPVNNPYNLYFTPDGSQAIVVAEGAQRLDFRDPHTFALNDSVQTDCYGINHLDYDKSLRYFIATCEFDGTLIKFDLATHRVVGKIRIDMGPSGRRARSGHAQPQDIRLSSDGSVFYVADLQSDGLYLIDGESFRQVGFIPAGVGTHSLYPSRDGRLMYVINRGTNIVGGPPHGKGSVSVLDPYTRTITADWPIPGGGSPDMGNITADGTQLWLGGRYDGEVYVFDLVHGQLSARIKVGVNPHGLTVWPQPGRFNLGHTGNMR